MRETTARAIAAAARGVADKIDNPLKGVEPSIKVFGVTFEGKAQLIAGGIWGLCLLAGALAIILAAGKWAYNSRVQHSMDGALEAAGQFKTAVMAFAAMCFVSLIIGAIIWVAG